MTTIRIFKATMNGKTVYGHYENDNITSHLYTLESDARALFTKNSFAIAIGTEVIRYGRTLGFLDNLTLI